MGDSYVSGLCQKLNGGLTGMEKAMGKNLKSDYTNLLIDKDNRRDNGFLGLRSFINSQLHSPNSEKAAAANKLAKLLGANGYSIHRLGYVDETAKLNTLISVFKKPENTALLTIIMADEWFTELINSQEDFENTYNSKISNESGMNFPLLKESKNIIVQYLRPLLTYVESNSWLNEEKYVSVEVKVDEIIKDIVTIARNRITRSENEKKKENEKK